MPHLPSLSWLRRRPDAGDWIVDRKVLLASYPSPSDLERYRNQGIRVVINLRRKSHDPELMARLGLTEVHLPVRDFTPPTPGQLDQGVAAISSAVRAGHGVLIHCAGGKGRSGTLAACYLVSQGMPFEQAIADVRAKRPGAIETSRQEKAVEVWSTLPGRSGRQ